MKHDLPEPTLRDREQQNRQHPDHVGHHHEQQTNPAQHSSQAHAGHDKHAGHSPAMFQRRFLICLVLTVPVLYLSPMFQMWFNYQAIQFTGVAWVTPILATVIYWYGGWVFLRGAWAELQGKIGMMTLVGLLADSDGDRRVYFDVYCVAVDWYGRFDICHQSGGDGAGDYLSSCTGFSHSLSHGRLMPRRWLPKTGFWCETAKHLNEREGLKRSHLIRQGH